jgi:hypothetical protein
MTALSEIQREQAENTKGKMQIGTLLWDLSAAYDNLGIKLQCKNWKNMALTILHTNGADLSSCAENRESM